MIIHESGMWYAPAMFRVGGTWEPIYWRGIEAEEPEANPKPERAPTWDGSWEWPALPVPIRLLVTDAIEAKRKGWNLRQFHSAVGKTWGDRWGQRRPCFSEILAAWRSAEAA